MEHVNKLWDDFLEVLKDARQKMPKGYAPIGVVFFKAELDGNGEAYIDLNSRMACAFNEAIDADAVRQISRKMQYGNMTEQVTGPEMADESLSGRGPTVFH